MSNMAAVPIYGQTVKSLIYDFITRRLNTLGLGMELRGIKTYQGGINEVPELALISVLVSSN